MSSAPASRPGARVRTASRSRVTSAPSAIAPGQLWAPGPSGPPATGPFRTRAKEAIAVDRPCAGAYTFAPVESSGRRPAAMSSCRDGRAPERVEPVTGRTGIYRGLTSYGDPEFSRYLRGAFLASSGFDGDDLSRPIVGVADTPSHFTTRHRQIPPPARALR